MATEFPFITQLAIEIELGPKAKSFNNNNKRKSFIKNTVTSGAELDQQSNCVGFWFFVFFLFFFFLPKSTSGINFKTLQIQLHEPQENCLDHVFQYFLRMLQSYTYNH